MQRSMKYRQHVGPAILSHDVRINQFMYRDTSSETRTSALSSTLNHRERLLGIIRSLMLVLWPVHYNLLSSCLPLLLLVAVILVGTIHFRTLMVKKRTAGKPGPAGRDRGTGSEATHRRRRRAGDASVEARALGPPHRLHSSSFLVVHI